MISVTTSRTMTINFSGRHFPSDIILQLVRYYLSYKLSYREIEEIYAERGINVDHSTLNHWVIKYAPLLEHRARKNKKPVASS
jgi:transposase-like protein